MTYLASTPSRTLSEHRTAVRDINKTLKESAAAVLITLDPALVGISQDRFYDVVMDDTILLQGCLQTFRQNRERFRDLLVDSRGRPVNDDLIPLRCGRSLQDVVAMIVRTHAKRHFRVVLGGNPDDPTSRAGSLYQAISAYLLHDWQVPLVPHYAPLPVALVRDLGPRLLDLHDVAAVQALTASTTTPDPAPASEAAPSSRSHDDAPGSVSSSAAAIPLSSPEAEFWWEALCDRSVAQALGNPTPERRQELVQILVGVNDAVRSELFAGLTLTTLQAAVCLATAFRQLGRPRFLAVFGRPGRPATVAGLATRLRDRGIGSRTDLLTLARATESLLRT